MSKCSFVAGIDQDVVKQIKAREEKFGKSPKTDEELEVIHGNCPWVVLRSGIDAPVHDSDRRKVFPREGTEKCLVTNDWAKKTVLAGELQDRSVPDFVKRPSGIQTIGTNGVRGLQESSQDMLRSAYRITDYQGHRPVSGITEFTVTSKDTWGMILEAVIKIKCWSRDELDMLDRVYFKPGFTALLEWGHTLYFRKDGTICKTPSMMISDEEFFRGGCYPILDRKILNKRKEDSNREAVFGNITNFSYSLNKDGSYDCTLKMLSKGSVIRGLRLKGTSQYSVAGDSNKEDDQLYEDKTVWHRIHQAFISFSESNPSDRGRTVGMREIEDDIRNYTTLPARTAAYKIPVGFGFDGKQAIEIGKSEKGYPLFDSKYRPDCSFPVLTINTSVKRPRRWLGKKREETKEFYITLRTLLYLINFYNSEERVKFNLWDDAAYVDIQEVKDEKGNVVVPAVSLNPLVAVKPRQGIGSDWDIHEGKNLLDSCIQHEVKGEQEGHRILNIWINFDQFVQEVDCQLSEKVQDYSILEALESLLAKIQKAFGNINEFQVVADHKVGDGLFAIIDTKDIQVVEDESELPPEIQVTGLNNTVSSLTITSEISSDISNQMSIAAQAPGTYQDGSENTDESMVHWGENCSNRWRLPPQDKYDSDTSATKESIEAMQKQEEQYKKNREEWVKKLKKAYKQIQKGQLQGEAENSSELAKTEAIGAAGEEAFRDIMINGETYFHGQRAEDVTGPNNPNLQMGIIPIRVGLTMMGIGNLTVGNVFRIKSGVLLPKYQNWAQIITGIEHHVTRAGWTTTLKTQYYPIYLDSDKVPSTTRMSSVMQSSVNSNIENEISSEYDPEELENACGILEAYKHSPYTFTTSHGMCARYTYSWARAYTKGKETLKLPGQKKSGTTSKGKSWTITMPPGINGGGVGNANDLTYETNIKSLGYREQTKRVGMTPAQITQYANSKCSTGDVLIYYLVDSKGNKIEGEYGHTQFYTGTGWVSDFEQNSSWKHSGHKNDVSPSNYKMVHLKAPKRHPDWECSA